MIDDLVQDTFIKVFTKIDAYDPNKSSFPHWVSSIAFNTVHTFHRDEGRRRKHFYEGDSSEELLAKQPDTLPTAQEVIEAREDAAAAAEAVSLAIKQVKDKPKKKILRLVLKGHDNAQLAAAMGYQSGNVTRVRKSEALKAARETEAMQRLAA
jgi:RNA polymerase sigma factor (sigma-70 family)